MSHPTPAYSALGLAGAVFLLVVTVTLLVEGRPILVPIAVAIIIWYILNAAADALADLRLLGRRPSKGTCLFVANLGAVGFLLFLVEIFSQSIADIRASVPIYQHNLNQLIERTATTLGFEQIPNVAQLVGLIDPNPVLQWFANLAAVLVSNMVLVIFYIIFLSTEQRNFDRKLARLFPQKARRYQIESVLRAIQEEIKKYIWIKFVMGAGLGAISYVTMALIGLDQSPFWALVIFLLSFIPTFGTLLGIAFPALVALLQFSSTGPFLIVAVVLGSAQVVANNFIEPRLMGRSLNLSPFIIFIWLTLWVYIWGITGGLICVPLMVMMMIILSQFPATRPLAIILSGNGEVPNIRRSDPTKDD